MNAAFLLMSTTLAAGPDAPPAAAPAPVLVQPAPAWPSPAYGAPGGCSSCAGTGISPGCADPCPCEKRKGLFGRLRGKGNDCDCSPKERRRLFHGFTTSACDDCGGGRDGLLSRLHARFHHKGNDCCDAGCGTVGGCGTSAWGGPAVGGCALPPVPSYSAPATPSVIPAPAPAEAPKQMEKEAPKADGTKNVSHSLPAPAPLPAPVPLPVPAIPVLADSKSPF